MFHPAAVPPAPKPKAKRKPSYKNGYNMTPEQRAESLALREKEHMEMIDRQQAAAAEKKRRDAANPLLQVGAWGPGALIDPAWLTSNGLNRDSIIRDALPQIDEPHTIIENALDHNLEMEFVETLVCDRNGKHGSHGDSPIKDGVAHILSAVADLVEKLLRGTLTIEQVGGETGAAGEACIIGDDLEKYLSDDLREMVRYMKAGAKNVYRGAFDDLPDGLANSVLEHVILPDIMNFDIQPEQLADAFDGFALDDVLTRMRMTRGCGPR